MAGSNENNPERDLSFNVQTTREEQSTHVRVKMHNKNKHNMVSNNYTMSLPDSEKKILFRSTSDQTILSFKILTQPGAEKKIIGKPRKSFINRFLPGMCVDFPSSDDEGPYLPSQPLSKKKTKTAAQNAVKKNKYKPGGCLDPPFGEERYAYEPAIVSEKSKLQHQLFSKGDIITTSETKISTNISAKSSGLITYPLPTTSDNLLEKTSSSTNKNNEKKRESSQLSASAEIFFQHPKLKVIKDVESETKNTYKDFLPVNIAIKEVTDSAVISGTEQNKLEGDHVDNIGTKKVTKPLAVTATEQNKFDENNDINIGTKVVVTKPLAIPRTEQNKLDDDYVVNIGTKEVETKPLAVPDTEQNKYDEDHPFDIGTKELTKPLAVTEKKLNKLDDNHVDTHNSGQIDEDKIRQGTDILKPDGRNNYLHTPITIDSSQNANDQDLSQIHGSYDEKTDKSIPKFTNSQSIKDVEPETIPTTGNYPTSDNENPKDKECENDSKSIKKNRDEKKYEKEIIGASIASDRLDDLNKGQEKQYPTHNEDNTNDIRQDLDYEKEYNKPSKELSDTKHKKQIEGLSPTPFDSESQGLQKYDTKDVNKFIDKDGMKDSKIDVIYESKTTKPADNLAVYSNFTSKDIEKITKSLDKDTVPNTYTDLLPNNVSEVIVTAKPIRTSDESPTTDNAAQRLSINTDPQPNKLLEAINLPTSNKTSDVHLNQKDTDTAKKIFDEDTIKNSTDQHLTSVFEATKSIWESDVNYEQENTDEKDTTPITSDFLDSKKTETTKPNDMLDVYLHTTTEDSEHINVAFDKNVQQSSTTDLLPNKISKAIETTKAIRISDVDLSPETETTNQLFGKDAIKSFTDILSEFMSDTVKTAKPIGSSNIDFKSIDEHANLHTEIPNTKSATAFNEHNLKSSSSSKLTNISLIDNLDSGVNKPMEKKYSGETSLFGEGVLTTGSKSNLYLNTDFDKLNEEHSLKSAELSIKTSIDKTQYDRPMIPDQTFSIKFDEKFSQQEGSGMKVNIVLQTYTDENKNTIIKSIDAESIDPKNKNMHLTEMDLKDFSDVIEVPIKSSSKTLVMQFKTLPSATQKNTQQPKTSSHAPKKDIHHKNTRFESLMMDEDDDLNKYLGMIYEQQLLPLQKTIRNLKNELKTLAEHRDILSENLNHSPKRKTRKSRSKLRYCGCYHK